MDAPTLRLLPSPGYAPDSPPPLGSIRPRLWTRPLRPLTPGSSYGYAVIEFAFVVLGEPLDPWQQWLVIHLGELLADGRPRFRQVLVIVGRQNGKTHLCKVLALFWLFVERWPLVFGTSTNLEQAAEAWQETVDAAKDLPALAAELPRNAVRLANGQQTFRTVHRSVYKIGAVNRKGGRGKRIDRMVGDELREHRTWVGYSAAYGAMGARPRGQAVFITNQGDAKSVVLISLRKAAMDYLEDGTGDARLGLFEWSAPPGTHPMDVTGWAAANPQLGRGRMDYDQMHGLAARVSKPGADPEELASFLTEYLCMAVTALDPAVDGGAWVRGRLPGAVSLDERTRLAACVDVSPDLQHATLAVAVGGGPKIRVEVVQSWSGPDAVSRLEAELPGWVAKIRPKSLGWFPGGPAAAIDSTLRDRSKAGGGGRHWPPRGVTVEQLQAEAPAVCMGFATQVTAGAVLHSGQDLLDTHVTAAERLWTGDRWVFTRRGAGHVDAAYAAAGAVHLARTMPAPRKVSRRVQVATGA
jgi:hypothetical protein